MEASDSVYARVAARLAQLPEKCFKDYRYFVSLLLMTSAVIVSTVVFSQKACAEVGGCQSSMECIACEDAKKICEEKKQELRDLAMQAAYGLAASAILASFGCVPCTISAISFGLLMAGIHYVNGSIQCPTCHTECYHCTQLM